MKIFGHVKYSSTLKCRSPKIHNLSFNKGMKKEQDKLLNTKFVKIQNYTVFKK